MFQLPSIEVIARAKALENRRAIEELIVAQRSEPRPTKSELIGYDIRVRIVLQPSLSVAVSTGRAGR